MVSSIKVKTLRHKTDNNELARTMDQQRHGWRRCRSLMSTALPAAVVYSTSTTITVAYQVAPLTIPSRQQSNNMLSGRLYRSRSCSRFREYKLYVDATPMDRGAAPSGMQPDTTSTDVNDPTEMAISEVDVLYGQQAQLVYDPALERYVKRKHDDERLLSSSRSTDHSRSRRRTLWWPRQWWRNTLWPVLSVAFLPSGVTSNYYTFIRWRVVQRFVNANLHVFGTQSLLLGLGIKSSHSQLGALSAALNWVLKDALGKIVRMLWASRMGRRFDSDAKRWRYRSAFVFAAGNGLEIVTYVCPDLFLLWATLANCCKQVSMLTSSSTRTAIYNSFRDGTRENIGDITAKGEAQIAIVDLCGIASGVTLSKAVGTSVRSVLSVYVLLQALEIWCVYRQLRTVQYRVLNFERMIAVTGQFCDAIPTGMELAENGDMSAVNGNAVDRDSERTGKPSLLSSVSVMPTPQELAKTERIFLPPLHMSRRGIAFGSVGRTKLSPDELARLQTIFAKERFLLVVGENVKHPWHRRRRRHNRTIHLLENCHIVLHEEATNIDIVKSTLALAFLRRRLRAHAQHFDPTTVRSSDCLDLIAASVRDADRHFQALIRQLGKQGWESPARYMFGRVHMRAHWPLSIKKTSRPPQR